MWIDGYNFNNYNIGWWKTASLWDLRTLDNPVEKNSIMHAYLTIDNEVYNENEWTRKYYDAIGEISKDIWNEIDVMYDW